MKRIIATILALLLGSAIVTGCSTQQKSADAMNDKKNELETASTIKEDLPTVKIGLVTGAGGITDGGYNQSSWEGIQRASKEFGFEALYLESANDSDFLPHMETLVEEGCGLIICSGGYLMVDSAFEVAAANPEQFFVLVDSDANNGLDNLINVVFNQAEVSYLVGTIAATTTQSNKVGIVLGLADQTMNQFAYGYIAGVKDIKKETEVLQYNVNSFGDLPLGKSAAVDLAKEGADVIFHAAGGTGIGVIEGCAESGIWAIGADIDQSFLSPEHILSSAIKRTDIASYDIAKTFYENKLTSGLRKYDVSNGGVDFSSNHENLTPEALEAVQKAKDDIIAGKVVVPTDKESFESQYGDLYKFD